MCAKSAHLSAIKTGNNCFILHLITFCLQGEGFSVSNVKSRSQQKNPIQRWTVGRGAINQFEFGGANSAFLATVSQDGFLRIFKYSSMELYAVMRSYFGGLLCLAWSPDHKLIATGGEDDLLTVYSVQEKRVLCRGQGHKSFVSQARNSLTFWFELL